jgi:hypothetical protein
MFPVKRCLIRFYFINRANNIDSALCMYKMSSVESAMKGYFKNNPERKPYKPYPSCGNYKNLNNKETDDYYRDMTRNSKFQMDQTVNERALFALNNVKFTSITVDTVSDSERGHVLFVGLNDGRVLKIVNKPVFSPETSEIMYTQPIIVNEYQLFESRVPINNLIVSSSSLDERKLVAVTDQQIKSIPVSVSCDRYETCEQCVLAQDPYCSWNLDEAKCVFSLKIFER